jgi:hypothetical protein
MPGVDPATLPPEKRRHKFGAVRTEVDNISFASKKEARRYGELKILETAGKIACLELQPEYEMHGIHGDKVGVYTADYRYLDLETGETVVEDVKSKATRTTAYRLRKRMVEAEYRIKIREV